jgi:hypothetical protein
VKPLLPADEKLSHQEVNGLKPLDSQANDNDQKPSELQPPVPSPVLQQEDKVPATVLPSDADLPKLGDQLEGYISTSLLTNLYSSHKESVALPKDKPETLTASQ